MPKVSNQTNSTDPQMINSRVFVGNLNTFAVTKEDVENIFMRYGPIYGISMHKGYAFVQFCSEYDGRKAVAGEEGRVVAGQTLDINMASEPKPNRPSRGGTTGGVTDWNNYYDSGYNQAIPSMRGPTMKRPRSDNVMAIRRELVQVRPRGKTTPRQSINSSGLFIEYNAADVVICGNCKEQFENLESMLIHRKTHCKYRFACKCQEMADKAALEAGPYHCSFCQEVFPNLWDAVFHVQNSHNIKVVREEIKENKSKVQDNVDGSGNHEDEISADTQPILESGDGEGEFTIDGNGAPEDPLFQDYGEEATE